MPPNVTTEKSKSSVFDGPPGRAAVRQILYKSCYIGKKKIKHLITTIHEIFSQFSGLNKPDPHVAGNHFGVSTLLGQGVPTR